MSILGVLNQRINSRTNTVIPISKKVSVAQEAIVEDLGVQVRSNLVNSFFTNQSDEIIRFIDQYRKDLWVYLCTNRIAQSISRIPIRIFRKKNRNGLRGITKSEYKIITKQYDVRLPPYGLGLECFISNETLKDFPVNLLYKLDDFIEELTSPHPLVQLINKPNNFLTKYGLIEGSITYLELRGDSFIELVGMQKGPVSAENPPIEMWHHNPDNIIIIPDKKEFVKGYVFEIGGQEPVPILRENMLHFKYFNPRDPYYGQGTLEALVDTLIERKNIINSEKKFYKQGMRPSGVLESEEKLADVQYERMLDQLIENFGGIRNFHKPLLLEGGLKWNQMSISQRESELIETKKFEREDFLAAYGIPPVLMGLPVENYATAEVGKKTFYQDTLMPKTQIHEDIINNNLVPFFGDDIFVKFDYTDTPAMQLDRESFQKTLSTSFRESVISRNEYRSNLHRVGIELSEKIELGEEGDKFFISNNLMPVEFSTAQDDLSEGRDDEDDEEDEE